MFMKKTSALILLFSSLLLVSCKDKKEDQYNIIVPAPDTTEKKKEVLEMSETHQKYIAELDGTKYSIDIVRSPDTTLPKASDEMRNAYYDNIITVRIQGDDGSVLLNKTYRKSDFLPYISGSGLEKSGALLGIVFDKTEDGCLSFAASVGSPDSNSDQYIPLVMTVSKTGSVNITLDTKMDVGEEPDMDEEGV